MKIVGFGDFLIHLSPEGNERFFQANSFKVSYTGAEANVCAALGYWGADVGFVTRVPDHALANRGISNLRALGVDTSGCAIGKERLGVFYLENGTSLRPSSVIYDRFNSSITEASYEDFDWDRILSDADMLYLTGITPVLSDKLYEICKKLLPEAKKRGVQVAYDVNFRPTLTTPQRAGEILREFAPCITTLIGNEEHLKMLLGISSEYGEDETEKRLTDITDKTRAILGVDRIAVTVRRTLSASDAIVFASLSQNGEFAVSGRHQIHVVDRVGSGDAFSAGIIYSVINNLPTDEAINFAAASNAMKHTILNDINYATVDEIKRLATDKSMDVKR